MKITYTLDNINSTIDQIFNYLSENNSKKIILFNGKMGAGKTTLIKKLADKFDVIDEVTSPTFAIINEYQTKKDDFICHFDFYRLKDIQEAINIGTEDYFYSNNYCFIEWAEIVKPILPVDKIIEINIEEIDNFTREIMIRN